VISVALFLIPRRRTAPWLAVLAAGSLAFRYALYFTQAKPEAALVVLLPSRLDGFLLGGLLALMHLGAEADARSRRRLLAGAVLALSVVFLGLYISGKFGSLRVYAAPLYYTVISMAGAALLELCTVRARPVAWVMGSWPLTEAGRLSYFVYLFHMPIALVLFHLALHSAPSLASPRAMAVMAGVCAVIYAAAKLSYVFLEGPLIRYSHTLVRRPPPVPAVAVSPAANS